MKPLFKIAIISCVVLLLFTYISAVCVKNWIGNPMPVAAFKRSLANMNFVIREESTSVAGDNELPLLQRRVFKTAQNVPIGSALPLEYRYILSGSNDADHFILTALEMSGKVYSCSVNIDGYSQLAEKFIKDFKLLHPDFDLIKKVNP
jgi:hypothetical protein